jgi:hypothetical protein
MRTIIVAAALALTLAGLTSATGSQTEPEPCRVAVPQPTAQDLPGGAA